ncbi:hypothetical protein AB0M20_38690 [Actinoplanes sp. NPDC051633]|uniref:hypothetical protein n=1 Tax=Actinoplanes sp. NPDC051633 TaxID=3155670 RepID=UPI0034343E61
MSDAFPFLAAILLLLVNPLLTSRARKEVKTWIDRSKPYAQAKDEAIPDYLSEKVVLDYVVYAADAVQIVPAIVLTAVGMVLALPGISPLVGAGVMLVVVLAIVWLDTRVSMMSPSAYFRQKVAGVSLVAGVGIVVNTAGLAVVALT